MTLKLLGDGTEQTWTVPTSDLGADLDDVFAEDDAALDFDTEPEPLTNAEQIDRRLATLRRAERRLAEYDAIAADRERELADRIARGRGPLVEKVGYWTRSLELTHQALLEADRSRTSVTLPNGKLTSKAGGVEWKWPDNDHEAGELLAWLAENAPALVVQPEPLIPPARPDKNAIKAAVKARTITRRDGSQVPADEQGRVITDDGEVIPGVHVVAKPRTFTPITAGMDE